MDFKNEFIRGFAKEYIKYQHNQDSSVEIVKDIATVKMTQQHFEISIGNLRKKDITEIIEILPQMIDRKM